MNPDKLLLLRGELDNIDEAAIYAGIARLAPSLLVLVPKVRAYAEDLAKRFGSPS